MRWHDDSPPQIAEFPRIIQSASGFFLQFALPSPIVSASEHKPIDKDRLVSAVQAEDDASYELKLRPRYLREFIGQKKVKENLSVAVAGHHHRQ
jgi:hypothetical protein